jgi:hypothetical protein
MNTSYYSSYSRPTYYNSKHSQSPFYKLKLIKTLIIFTSILLFIFSFSLMMKVYANSQENSLFNHNTTNINTNENEILHDSHLEFSYQVHSSNGTLENRVVVQYGDSLWEIASVAKPEKISTNAYIKSIKKKNHLQSSDIQEGQVLILP